MVDVECSIVFDGHRAWFWTMKRCRRLVMPTGFQISLPGYEPSFRFDEITLVRQEVVIQPWGLSIPVYAQEGVIVTPEILDLMPREDRERFDRWRQM